MRAPAAIWQAVRAVWFAAAILLLLVSLFLPPTGDAGDGPGPYLSAGLPPDLDRPLGTDGRGRGLLPVGLLAARNSLVAAGLISLWAAGAALMLALIGLLAGRPTARRILFVTHQVGLLPLWLPAIVLAGVSGGGIGPVVAAIGTIRAVPTASALLRGMMPGLRGRLRLAGLRAALTGPHGLPSLTVWLAVNALAGLSLETAAGFVGDAGRVGLGGLLRSGLDSLPLFWWPLAVPTVWYCLCASALYLLARRLRRRHAVTVENWL